MFHKLSTQIGILCFLGISTILGSVYWLEYNNKSKQLPVLVENEAVLSTQLIASGVSNAVHYQRTFQIWKQMIPTQRSYLKDHRMIMSEFAILNENKLILAHSNPKDHPVMKPMLLPALGVTWHNNSIRIVQEIHHPSDGRTIGYIALTFDALSIPKALKEIRNQSIISLAYALLFSILLAFALSYRISIPLRHITDLAERIGDGDSDLSRISGKASEIQALSNAIYKADHTIHEKNLALIESQKLLKSILDHSPAVIFIKDLNGRYILVNECYEKLFHIKQADVIGKTLADIFDSETAKKLCENDLNVIANAKPCIVEETVPDKRGVRHYLSLKFPLFDAMGNVEAVCGIATDITDQKKDHETALKLVTVIEQAGELIVLTDKDGVIEYVNKAFEQVTGYTSNEVIGKKPSVVRSGEHSPEYYFNMWKELHAGKTWFGDFINKTKSGELYEVTQSITPIKNEQGDITGYSSVQRDVTHVRKIQQKLQHTDRVESLGILAGGIAHDFNNLLTAILGNTVLALKRLEPNSEAIKYLGSIEAASHSAADLCRQMLAYAGQGKFVVEAINLSEIVATMCKLIDVSIAKNVTLTYHLNDKIPAIDADIAQIKQIILNLITNASEAIENTNGVISVSTGVMQVDADYLNGCISAETLKPGHFVYLEVSDTGTGMSKETQKKIFDPFFTTKFTGRGLGMSAMLGIVKGHHGGLRIYSELGSGTTIKVVFPISAKSSASQEKKRKEISAWKGSGAILVVDDEEALRDVARAMLEDIGFDVITANDGIEGVEAYRKQHNDIRLVLLDMTMPRMDGQSCFRELRLINPDVRVLLSSGYNEQDATSHFSGKGLAGFIQKPYPIDALSDKLQELLQGNTAEDTGSKSSQ